MARINKSVAPYYDDFNRDKQYTQFLAIPGRVAQAREFTQIQSVIKDMMKSLGDSILKEGNIIEGCQVLVNSTKTAATVTAGKIYIGGLVLPVEASTVPINGVGTELIGVKLMETIITEADDDTLRDPAQGYDNFNQAGCHRVKSWVIVVVDDPEASIIATLIDGSLAVETYVPEYDVLTQTLARRTYDESGSYIVDGLTVRIEAHASDETKFNVVVESGKAYVLGYELRIPAPRRITLPRALTYNSVTANNYWYNNSEDMYLLASAPYVKRITSVKGFVSRTVTQTITSNTDRVLIDELEVSQLVSVSQGATNYTVGATESTGDCYLQREGTRYYVKWNGTANYPTLNASYTVTYTYNHLFTEATDYELALSNDSHYLKWLGASTPNNSTNFTVVYDQYYARKDIVYIDRYGSIATIQGAPAEYGFEVVPNAPLNTLPLATVTSPPGGSITTNPSQSVTISNVGLTRFTMNDIQRLLNRIRTLEYDQAVLSLNDEARQHETATSKRGIFTDPLIDLSKIDYYYNLADGEIVDGGKPIYDVSMDLTNNLCYLPTNTYTHDMTYDEGSTTKKYGRTATLNKSGETVVLAQQNATKSFLINPYSVFPQLPEISISPAVDVWIEDSIITVPVSLNTTEVLAASTRHIESRAYWGSSYNYSTTSSSVADTVIGTKVNTSSTESVVNENAITYIRTRTIDVEGMRFPSNLDNIKCYFDGVLAPLTPTGDTVAGTAPGSVRADIKGGFKAKFTIPEKILTGIREVRLVSSTNVDGYESSAFALYQATGTARTIQRTVTTLTTVLMNRVTTVSTTRYYVDPVGQTFVLDKMTLVSGVDLYFEAKPEGNTPVTCEIREVVNGMITPTIYGHKTLDASSVNTSSDGEVATRFTFEDPVLLEENKEYAFVVRSTSAAYRIWVAELGGKDIISGDIVLANPYLIGVMLSSSNNSSWSTHQTTDVKFRIIADTYANTSEMLFNSVEEAREFSRIYTLADTVVPHGTSIDWYYSTDEGVSFKTITPYNIVHLDQMKSSLMIKATLKRDANTTLSPIIALDSVGAVLSSYDDVGYYITKNITGLDAYTTVDIVLDTYLPSGTTLEVYVSEDNGSTKTLASLKEGSTKTLNYGWREQTYSVTVTSSTQCKLFIKLASNYQYFTPSFRRVRMIMS